MGWTPPDGLLMCQSRCVEHLQEASITEVSTIGLDIAKSVFQAHGLMPPGVSCSAMAFGEAELPQYPDHGAVPCKLPGGAACRWCRNALATRSSVLGGLRPKAIACKTSLGGFAVPVTFNEDDWAHLTSRDKIAIRKLAPALSEFEPLTKFSGLGQTGVANLIAKGLAEQGASSWPTISLRAVTGSPRRAGLPTSGALGTGYASFPKILRGAFLQALAGSTCSRFPAAYATSGTPVFVKPCGQPGGMTLAWPSWYRCKHRLNKMRSILLMGKGAPEAPTDPKASPTASGH